VRVGKYIDWRPKLGMGNLAQRCGRSSAFRTFPFATDRFVDAIDSLIRFKRIPVQTYDFGRFSHRNRRRRLKCRQRKSPRTVMWMGFSSCWRRLLMDISQIRRSRLGIHWDDHKPRFSRLVRVPRNWGRRSRPSSALGGSTETLTDEPAGFWPLLPLPRTRRGSALVSPTVGYWNQS